MNYLNFGEIYNMNLIDETQTGIKALTGLRDSYLNEGHKLIDNANKIDEVIKMLQGDAEDKKDVVSSKPVILQTVPHERNKRKYKQRKNAPISIAQRAIEIIKQQDRFLTRKEIEEIGKQQGSPFTGSIIANISAAKKKPQSELGMIYIDSTLSVWGLKKWIGNDGNVKPEYQNKFSDYTIKEIAAI